MLKYILSKTKENYHINFIDASIEFKANFDFKTSFTTNDPIIEKIFETDGTVKRYLSRGNQIEWLLKINEGDLITQKFRPILSYFVRSKKITTHAYPYQCQGISWLSKDKARILADDMGLGKTLQCLGAISNLFYEKLCEKAIILCPNNLTKNWFMETRAWCPQLQCVELTSQKMHDQKYFEKIYHSANVLIIPYSSSTIFSKFIENQKHKIGVLVADEAHKLRNASSNLHKSFKALNAEATWLLTGTPLERDEIDIRNVLSLLYPKKASVYRTLNQIFLKENLRAVSLRREKKDVLQDLPKVLKKTEWLELTSRQRNSYKSILEGMSKASGEKKIGFISALVQEVAGINDVNSAKISRAVEIVRDCIISKKKTLIFSNFNTVLKTQKQALTNAKISCYEFNGTLTVESRQKNLKQFKSSAVPCVLLANSQSASEGLTLTEASTVIFLNEWWNPSSNRQAEDRVNRIGQTEPVIIYNLRAINTIDENLSRILESKIKLENIFLNMLTKQVLDKTNVHI